MIILGTGLKESILSGLLSSRGKKVLHMDRNNYYGGECASLNLTNLYKKFIKDEEPPKAFFDALGSNRDYNVDLVPKFIMANGKLVKVLVLTDVTRYMDFKLVDGSYVYRRAQKGGMFGGASAPIISKVPADEAEAIKTGLISLVQKGWLRGFLKYIAKYDQADPKTWDGMDLSQATMKQLFDKMWLDEDAQEFLGHAMALEPDDGYLARPALETVKALRLYAESLDRYGKSPFIYPIYGLGNLPEGFSRLCAIHGGIFILNKPVDEILRNADGTAAGVRSGSGDAAEVALAPIIIGDPSYFPKEMVRKTGSVVRLICILSKPVKGVEGDSGQIIIPQKQVGRKNGALDALPGALRPLHACPLALGGLCLTSPYNPQPPLPPPRARAADIYISVLGYSHRVVANGKYCAILSTTVETAKPAEELKAALDMLPADGRITQFENLTHTLEPVEDGSASKIFITSSYDASSHFEITTDEVLAMYKRITGEELDLTQKAEVDMGAGGGGH